MIDYAKGWAFQEYVRCNKLIDYNSIYKHRKHFVPYLQRKAEWLVDKYPDFPQAYEENYGRLPRIFD